MHPDRRRFLQVTSAGLLVAAPEAVLAGPKAHRVEPSALIPDSAADQTTGLQDAIDLAARRGVPLTLPAGSFRTRTLTLRPRSVVAGASGLTTLVQIGDGPLLSAVNAEDIALAQIAVDGAYRSLGTAEHPSLVAFDGCNNLTIEGLSLRRAAGNGLTLTGSTGRITGCLISDCAAAALLSLDGTMSIISNTISNCANNGILVWRSAPAEDGSRVAGNRVSGIRADGGGTGQNGNGINVFRACGVLVADNRISACAYSAVRGNAASNLTVTGNQCSELGEVAIYVEFGFTGALIANNLIDGAATGISVTNFNDGGRLAVVQGNLIRNLKRRESDPVDKRGEGIAVEADTSVSGNTIENAETCGLWLGTGSYMRDLTATGNLIRSTPVGILISADPAAGRALVTGNLISGTPDGAIRAQVNGRPFGPDLALEPPLTGRVVISGNSAG